jgi:16S rRNA (adenine(1408)-N(1))-methyltransferase
MEIIQGKAALSLDRTALLQRAAGYTHIQLDIGTGDGRFVVHTAQSNPDLFVIGLDSCRENLRERSRNAPPNALFVIANALALPAELRGTAAGVTINFPWGSLLDGLLCGDGGLLAGLDTVMCPGATLELRLNGGALAEAGWSLEDGTGRVWEVLAAHGFILSAPAPLTAADLKRCPTTWAKRLAFGRDPRAVYLRGMKGESYITRIA